MTGMLEREKPTEVANVPPMTSGGKGDSDNGSSPLEESRKEIELLKLREKVAKLNKPCTSTNCLVLRG
jgi:hypothetical protein